MSEDWSDLNTLQGPRSTRDGLARDVDAGSRWELYRLLADPLRPRLLALVALHELGVGELADLLRESQPKVSRHAAALRDAEVIAARRQGTWTLLKLARGADRDAVIADAIAAGTASCRADGTLARVDEILRARDAATRDFFARNRAPLQVGAPPEVAAYLAALAPLIEHRRLAVDAGTGDGALLEVLAPVFDRVVGLDRADSRIAMAAERVRRRELGNVTLVCGEVDGPEIRRETSAGGGADAVFASRFLHHAPLPERAFTSLAALARPASDAARGGAVVVLDYEPHEDQELSEKQADLWLGFEPEELSRLGHHAGLVDARVTRLPAAWRGDGPDRHLDWQLYVGFRGRK